MCLSRILLEPKHLRSVMQCVKLNYMIKNFKKWREVMVFNFFNLLLKIVFENVWELCIRVRARSQQTVLSSDVFDSL